jgi:hypothetical protein
MRLSMDGNLQTEGFGTKMVEPVFFPTTTGPQVTGVGLADALTDVSTGIQTGRTASEWTASMYRLDFSIEEYRMQQFGSQTQKVSWVESQMKQAIKRFFHKHDQDLWGTEDDTNAGTDKQLNAIRQLINTGGTSGTDGGAQPPALASQSVAAMNATSGSTPVYTVGGIARNAAGAAYWSSNLIGAAASAEVMTLRTFSKLISASTVGTEKPTLILCYRDEYDKLEQLLGHGGTLDSSVYTGGAQYSGPLARAGFNAIGVRGVEVVPEDRMPTTGFVGSTATYRQIFCLNTNHLKMKMREKRPTFRKVDDPRPLVRYVATCMLQLTSDNLGRVHARHINVAA